MKLKLKIRVYKQLDYILSITILEAQFEVKILRNKGKNQQVKKEINHAQK